MFLAWWQSSQTSKEVYELRNFTNTNRKNGPKCSFWRGTFFSSQWHKKVKILLSPTLPPPYFLSPFFKTFVTHPNNINELDTVVTPTLVLRPWHPLKIWKVHLHDSSGLPYIKDRLLSSATRTLERISKNPVVEESITFNRVNPAWDRFPTPLSVIHLVSL